MLENSACEREKKDYRFSLMQLMCLGYLALKGCLQTQISKEGGHLGLIHLLEAIASAICMSKLCPPLLKLLFYLTMVF